MPLVRRGRGSVPAIVVGGLLLWGSAAGAQEATFGRDYLIGELTPITDFGAEQRPPSVDLDIRFEYDSARLTPSARAQLTELGFAITAPALQASRFGIYGHTDAAGSDDYNLNLSIRRAGAVRDFLLAAFNVTADRLEVAGYGETRLKYPDAPRDGRNRRVEIVNLTPLVAEPEPEPEPESAHQPDRGGSGWRGSAGREEPPAFGGGGFDTVPDAGSDDGGVFTFR